MEREAIEDIFAAFGPVSVRRLFGGVGVYAGGVMFALGHSGELYLKADAELVCQLEARGSKPFTYEGKRSIVALGYWSVPADALDEPEEVAGLARAALAVAQAARASSAHGRRRSERVR
ncbi:TfoX/Sxy family protein [Ancylobacter sp. 6x-1]|uniref:TfoX/Sxy family protein n=1 Tax=Ancylobacter crimeensis TaxID=2579147 RepID=A0ABT0D6C8_9HYPH|nr:TfoX/Sxy family protein [Ancylobacter crimeensis]MCK0195495.1 TfoX/Sxy family protein [Ancylobacter crimeensis]